MHATTREGEIQWPLQPLAGLGTHYMIEDAEQQQYVWPSN
jgi:hypothetical protein